MLRVLCVCKGNTCRSPMFAALLRQQLELRGQTDVSVESAGYMKEAAGRPANEEWVTLQAETGIDLGDHLSRWIGSVDLSAFDIILCMEPTAVDEVRKMAGVDPGKVRLVNESEGGIPNPYQKGTDAYRDCYVATCRVVTELAPTL